MDALRTRMAGTAALLVKDSGTVTGTDFVARARWTGRRLQVLALALGLGFGCTVQKDEGDQLPKPQAARRALEKCLNQWREAAAVDRTVSNPAPLLFVDQQRQPGQKLREYTILSQSEVSGCQRFMVRLALEDPEESLVAPYYVFGTDMVWVYRGEDFDMLMHMDHRMTAVPASAGDVSGSAKNGEPPSTKEKHHHNVGP